MMIRARADEKIVSPKKLRRGKQRKGKSVEKFIKICYNNLIEK
jgi:hypothetical protein